MVHIGTLLLLIPAVYSSDLLHVHKKAHLPGSVRLLRANETVNPTGSDIVFSWEQCVICDGYEVQLHLENVMGRRRIPYKLKSTVTTLKITDVLPRTAFRLVVKKLPSDVSSSEVSGRSFAPKAPPPVENLVVRALTSSSIHVEWDSENADGYALRIFENDTVVEERVISNFSSHSSTVVGELTPKKVYQVQVVAFFSPQTEESFSPVSAAQVETLPVELPALNLSWELTTKLKLSWSNPEHPSPLTHHLHCNQGDRTIFDADLSGSADFVALSGISRAEEISCLLQTWFSTHEDTKVETRLSIPKEEEKSTATSYSMNLWCSSGYPISYSATLDLERIETTEWLVVTFSESHSNYLVFRELQYKLCEETRTCDDSWTSLPSNEYPRLLLKPGIIKPWTRYTVQYRFHLRCYYDNYGPQYTTTRSLELPVIFGPVEPVSEFFATKTGVAWEYGSSSISPDYFLVTYCAEKKCISQSVPGENRSVTLAQLKGSLVYDASIQAVRIRNGEAHVSPTGMTSFVAPDFKLSENVIVGVEEIIDSPVVRLVVAHNSSADVPAAVEYHVELCGTPAHIWKDEQLAEMLGSNTTCKSLVSRNSSIDLIREPWISYEATVLICYGAFDSDNPVKKMLPILKQDPEPVLHPTVAVTQRGALFQWSHEPPIPSGFFVKTCSGVTDVCNYSEAGPLDRSYSVDHNLLPVGSLSVSIIPFVVYEGIVYNATNYESTLYDWPAPSSDIR